MSLHEGIAPHQQETETEALPLPRTGEVLGVWGTHPKFATIAFLLDAFDSSQTTHDSFVIPPHLENLSSDHVAQLTEHAGVTNPGITPEEVHVFYQVVQTRASQILEQARDQIDSRTLHESIQAAHKALIDEDGREEAIRHQQQLANGMTRTGAENSMGCRLQGRIYFEYPGRSSRVISRLLTS